MNLQDLKSAKVGLVDTPLATLEHLGEHLSKGPIYIKRDDLTGLAFGGNKARKLDYLVQYALDHHYTTLMTFGGVQSNHARMTAAAAAAKGLKSILVLMGPKPQTCSGNLILDRMMDCELVFVDTSAFAGQKDQKEKTKAYLDRCVKQIVEEKEKAGEKVLNIPIGGQGVIGSAGYIKAVPEIMRQMQEQNISAKYLVCGYGSTGTFAGLVAGALAYKAPFEIIGIPVQPDYHPQAECAAFVNQLSEYYDLGFTCTPDMIRVEPGLPEDPYYGLGYDIPDEKTQETMRLMASLEGIFVDPCYTGKVLRGMCDLIKRGVIEENAGVIFLHSGGTPAIWSSEHLDFAQTVLWNDDHNIQVFKAEAV